MVVLICSSFFLRPTKKKMEEHVVFIDAHTLETTVEPGRNCLGCHRMLRSSQFYPNTTRCKRCYDQHWMEKQDMASQLPVEMHVGRAVYRANCRSRHRKSVGLPLTFEEAMGKWTGQCANCEQALNFKWHPRTPNENLAIIDRVRTARNESYAGNMDWLCYVCNKEKGPWDLVQQLNQQIKELKKQVKRLKRKRKKAAIPYASVLMSA